jgi:hypothetical protein
MDLKPVEVIFGLLVTVAALNVVVNGQNTAPVISTTLSGTNDIFKTLTAR